MNCFLSEASNGSYENVIPAGLKEIILGGEDSA